MAQKDAFLYLLRHGDRTRIDNLLARTHRLSTKQKQGRGRSVPVS
jgi:hypothetical protein